MLQTAGLGHDQLIRRTASSIICSVTHCPRSSAVVSDERARFSVYRRLLQNLPDDNRATLNALFGHFYM